MISYKQTHSDIKCLHINDATRRVTHPASIRGIGPTHARAKHAGNDGEDFLERLPTCGALS